MRTVKYWDRKGLGELEAGCIAMDQLDFESESHQKNREAEESHFRRNVWGSKEKAPAEEGEGDKVGGNRYLGEFHSTPVVYPPQQSSSSGLLAGLAIGAIPAALLAGYLFAKQPETPSKDTDTNSTYRVEKWIPDNTVPK